MAKKKDKTLYDEHSIESLTPLQFTRHSPGVYCGDTTYSTQLLVEIISNSIDEFRLGHGNKIEVTLSGTDNKDYTISVRDYAQGFVTNSFREDGKSVFEAAFNVLNTSGKYREDGTYEGTSLGSFGIGAKLATFLANSLTATTWRDNDSEVIKFIEGEFKERTKSNSNEPSGTLVEWKPSKEFFSHTEVELDKVNNLFKTLSCLCSGLTIVLNNHGKITEFVSKNGLNDLVDTAVKKIEIIPKRFVLNYVNGKNKIDLVATYTSSYSSTLIPYVNTGLTESGQHISQVKAIFTRELNKFFKEKGWLKDKDENLSGEDIQEGMYVVFNITAPGIAYDAQVKSRITKIDMTPFTRAIADDLSTWLSVNEKDIKIIADKAINARKARDAAKKARDTARTVNKKSKKQFLDLPTKLVDCWSSNREECELFIVEGDSAASGIISGRDSKTIAVFPVRGKMIGSFKSTDEKIFANAEINNLIKALGLELNTTTKKLIYDKNKLRYGKIVAAADADPDGKSIKNLLYANIWYLCPELIINGHMYTAIPPLFRITTKKNEYIYLKDQSELDKYKENHKSESYTVSRSKGLGEQDDEELSLTILDKKTRHVEQITVDDVKKTEDMLTMLMGTSVPPRRAYLLAHSEEAEV